MKTLSGKILVNLTTPKKISCHFYGFSDDERIQIEKMFAEYCKNNILSLPLTKFFSSKNRLEYFLDSFKDTTIDSQIMLHIDKNSLTFENKNPKPSSNDFATMFKYHFSGIFLTQDILIKKREITAHCIFISTEKDFDLKKFRKTVCGLAKSSIMVAEPYFNSKRIKNSPIRNSLPVIMRELNKQYDNRYYITHHWNIKTQQLTFLIRKKTWMEKSYKRESILNWAETFLPDFKKDIRKISDKITYLGKSQKLDVHIIESDNFLYAKDIKSIAKQHWFNNFFVIHNNTPDNTIPGFRSDDPWWRMDFWWSKKELLANGTINRDRHVLTTDVNTRHIFGNKRFIPFTYDISDDENYQNLLDCTAHSVEDIINKMNIKTHLKNPKNSLDVESYYIVDFYTNINPPYYDKYFFK